MRDIEKQKKRIRRIAYKVRAVVEEIAKNEKSYCDLAGYCARASALLSHELSKHQIGHNIVYGKNHMYILWNDYVVDITASQFYFRSGPKTMIRRLDRIKRSHEKSNDYNWWEVNKVFDSITEAQQHQRRKDWPRDQIINLDDLKHLEPEGV